MAKKNKIYCVYCGKENVLDDNKCSSCKKLLNPKNRPFRDYMVDKLKDKVEGDIQDNIFSLIVEFIKSHLYGFVITCSIIFTAGAIVTSLIDKPSEFEIVDNRPNIISKIEYKGKGLTPEEIVVKYGDALNSGDLKEIRAYELNSFYPELFEELKDKKVEKNGEVKYSFLKNNQLYENSEMVFKMEKEYDVSFYYGAIPKGKYGNYEFVRHPLYIEYGYPDIVYDPNDDKSEAYAFTYSIEFIKVDGDYYISGTQLDPFVSDQHELIFDFFVKYNGDTSKITYKEISKSISEIEG